MKWLSPKACQRSNQRTDNCCLQVQRQALQETYDEVILRWNSLPVAAVTKVGVSPELRSV